MSPDHRCWIRPKYAGFFLPVKVLRRVFRGKFVAALRRAYARGELDLHLRRMRARYRARREALAAAVAWPRAV